MWDNYVSTYVYKDFAWLTAGHEVAVLHDGARERDLAAGVEGDGEDEEAAGDVAELDEPALREADRVGPQDLARRRPVERDQEPQRLQQVRQDELVDQHDALVAPDEARVVRFPLRFVYGPRG